MFLSLLLLVALVRAAWVSVRERYWVGVAAAALRIALLAIVWYALAGSGALFVPVAPTRGLLLAGVCNLVGPVVTLALVFVAYRRFQEVPAAQEEETQRPFRAWLPAGIFDGLTLLLIVGGIVMGAGI